MFWKRFLSEQKNRLVLQQTLLKYRHDVFVVTATSGGKKYHYSLVQLYVKCLQSLSDVSGLISVHAVDVHILPALWVTSSRFVRLQIIRDV